jgi:hypothetical protein
MHDMRDGRAVRFARRRAIRSITICARASHFGLKLPLIK